MDEKPADPVKPVTNSLLLSQLAMYSFYELFMREGAGLVRLGGRVW